jgi:hypothetical protein
MTKTILFNIANQLWPLLLKHDTWYQKVVLFKIWLLCPIYYLAHGANFLVYHELFTTNILANYDRIE